MPHFYHRDQEILISLNYKVMFSSLTWLSRNSPAVMEIEQLSQIFAKPQSIFFKNHYLLVRNPYKKIISFYKDRFYFVSLTQKNNPCSPWQGVQKMIFPYLGIDEKRDSREQILKKWNISFVDFVSNILPKIYKMNGHLTPQHWIFYLRKREKGEIIITSTKKHPIFKNVEIIKIEDREALTKFCEKIGYDVNRKIHNTQKIEDPELTPDVIKIINKIYKDDFKIFGYPKLKT